MLAIISMTGWAGVDEAVEVVEVAAPEIAPVGPNGGGRTPAAWSVATAAASPEMRVAVAAGSMVWSAVAAAGSATRSATAVPGSVPWRAVAAAGLAA